MSFLALLAKRGVSRCDFRVKSGLLFLDTILYTGESKAMALQSLSIVDGPEAILANPEPQIAPPGIISLADSARVEFQTALQLLSERAAFLTAATGVAIAIEEAGVLTYRVTTGANVPEPDTRVNNADESVRTCLCESKAVRTSTGDSQSRLLCPITRGDAAIGFIEVISNYQFSDADTAAIARLAFLAGVALEHLEAAEAADAHFWEKLQQPLSPKLWHAPETTLSGAPTNHARSSPDHASPEISLCSCCGFPVSVGRTLCVECEQKPHAVVMASSQPFISPAPNSWWSEHGYTLASLIVTAIAAAVIFYLRR